MWRRAKKSRNILCPDWKHYCDSFELIPIGFRCVLFPVKTLSLKPCDVTQNEEAM